MSNLLLFGASGAIGREIASYFTAQGWHVIKVGRRATAVQAEGALPDVFFDVHEPTELSTFAAAGPFDGVCWAQGANLNDSSYNVEREAHLALYEANCLSVILSLQMLLAGKLLAPQARLCVISSIWQECSRQNKLSYSMTKAALRGFVLSAAADLARDGYLINAVLPGVLETPMTRANLKPEQIEKVEQGTLFGRLPEVRDVAFAAWSLLHADNRSITGQFLKVDRGYSNVRII